MAPQLWNASDYETNARFVSDLGAPLLRLLDPRVGERILDLGCGDGALTARLVEAGAEVVGVDVSRELLAAARQRRLDVREHDAAALPFDAEFDAVFSNAVLHWIPDHDRVLAGVRRALKPGGRFVGEFGGHGCVAAVCTALRAVAARRGLALRNPWNFPTVGEFSGRLVGSHLDPVSVELIPRPTILPSGMPAWLRTFAGSFFEQLPTAEQASAMAETVELLRPALCDAQGQWTADYIRLRFVARRPLVDTQ